MTTTPPPVTPAVTATACAKARHRVSFPPCPVSNTACLVGQFAIARACGSVCLVQLAANDTATTSDSTDIVPTDPEHMAAPSKIPSSPSSSLSTSPSSPMDMNTVTVRIFAHEFISIYTHTHTATLPPAQLAILEPLAPECMRLDAEDEDRVFLAKPIMERLTRMGDGRRRGELRRAG